MYETKLFENGKALLEWAQKNMAQWEWCRMKGNT